MAIVNWQDLKSIINLKLFLGFCNYYKKFIINQLDKIIKKNRELEMGKGVTKII